MLPLLLALAPAFLDFMSATPEPPPSRGQDMSALFATFKTCTACTNAGYGWCPMRRKCGGFANKECGVGEAYVVQGAIPSTEQPKKKTTEQPKKKTTKPARSPPSGGSNDMRATFAKLKTCSACVAAGYGWCPLQRRCGGFASRTCGVGAQYVSDAPAERNGLWEPKAKHKVEAASVEVPASVEVTETATAPPPAPAAILYAGPASPPPQLVAVSPPGGMEAMPNATASESKDELDLASLSQLSHAALISKVVELQSEVGALRRL